MPWPKEEFWLQAAPGGSSFRYESLKTMSRDADLIVVGRVARITPGRVIPEPDYGSSYGTLVIEVEDLVGGNLITDAPGTVAIEFFLSDAANYERFAVKVPDERVLLFLRNKAEEARRTGNDPDGPLAGELYYFISSSQGYVRDVDGYAEPPLPPVETWLEALRGLPFDQVVAMSKEAVTPR